MTKRAASISPEDSVVQLGGPASTMAFQMTYGQEPEIEVKKKEAAH